MDCYDGLGLQDYLTFEQTTLSTEKQLKILSQISQTVVITYVNNDQATQVYSLIVYIQYLKDKQVQQMKKTLNRQIQYNQSFRMQFTIYFPQNCGPVKLVLELHTSVYNYTNTFLLNPVNIYSSSVQDTPNFSIYSIKNESQLPVTLKTQMLSKEQSAQTFKASLPKNINNFVKVFQKRFGKRDILGIPSLDSILLPGEESATSYEKQKSQIIEKIVPIVSFLPLQMENRIISETQFYLQTIPYMKDGKPSVLEGKVGQLLEYKLKYAFNTQPTLQCQYNNKNNAILELVDHNIKPVESKTSGIITLYLVSSEIGFQHLQGWYITFNNKYIDLSNYVFVKIL